MSDMKSDYYYAEMLNLMREQGKKDNPVTLQLGIMQSENSVKVDDLILTAEDIYISDYLKADYKREFTLEHYTDDILSSTEKVKLITKDGLKKGDLVAVQKLSNNRYVILERVVAG
jgi:hypothetical protein